MTTETQMPDAAIIEAMMQRGGGFAQALAKAARLADQENLARIKATWPDYWATYSHHARMIAGGADQP